MNNQPTARPPRVHPHAAQRLGERFDLDADWLQAQLEAGQFVWLKASGNPLRSGHLFYLPDRDQYFLVVMDNRSRLAITVLTEDMATRSSWWRGLTPAAKLKARQRALGHAAVGDFDFLALYAVTRETLAVRLALRTYDKDWQGIVKTLMPIELTEDQFDPESRAVNLNELQMLEADARLKHMLQSSGIKPYGQLFVYTTGGRSVDVLNPSSVIGALEDAESVRRWKQQ